MPMIEPLIDLVRTEFAVETAYLNTASFGLPPARSLAAVRAATEDWAAGRSAPTSLDPVVATVRERFARLLGARPEDTALGSTVAPLVAQIAAALPPGAEVLHAQGEFTSTIQAFHHRGDLAVRTVPLERLAESVRPSTALVAVSAAQSADGRVTDIPALHSATLAHGARLMVDATQAAGWLPLRASDAEYWVCGAYKWLLGARSVGFLVLDPAAAEEDGVRPLAPGWYAAEDPWSSCYDALEGLARSARRFDSTPDWMGCVATAASLSLISELGVDAIHAHDLALAARFRAGLAELGLKPLSDAPSAIVSVQVPEPPDLAASGVIAANRAGALRFAFHAYNTPADVDAALQALSRA